MNNFNLQYSPFYIILCLALGLLYAVFLYYRDRRFEEQKSWLPYLLGFFRFMVVSGLSFLLLVPTLKSIFEDTKPPIIVIAEDESESTNYENNDNYKADIDQLANDLSSEFQVDRYYFSNTISTEIPDSISRKSTNLEKVFTTIDELYINQNVGAVILATDGIYNEGKNPLYLKNNISSPVYPIALGDTTQRKDITIQRALHNKIVFLNDKFSVQIDINAQNCAGSSSNLRIQQVNEDGSRTTIQNVPIRINESNFFSTQEIILEANAPGVARYVASLSPIEGEISTENNRKDIFIEVLDARQKILILANAPHPDISALKQIIESNKNYEISQQYISDLNLPNDNFDLVIFHNLPSSARNVSDLLNRPTLQNAAQLYFVGSQTNQSAFNQIQQLLSIEGSSNSLNETQAIIEGNFNLFNLSDELKQQIGQYPPVLSPFGNYAMNPAASVLLSQKIGKVDTDYPLYAIMDQDGKKTGVIAAEGIWKWKLYNFLQNGNYDIIEEIINKSLQYLTLKEDKRRFRVYPTRNIFKENENIVFTGELYNDSYEKVNEEEVFLTISDQEGKDYNFTFSRRADYYYLDAGQFPPGNYRFSSYVIYNGNRQETSGRFSIENIQLEAYDLTARHGLLRSIANQFGGQLIQSNEINSLVEIISSNNQIKPVVYASTRTEKLMNNKWVFFILFGFLAIEWFLRRYFGSY